MNRLLVLIGGLMPILLASSAWAQDRTVTIFFTHNDSRNRTRHPADCLGSVTHEVLRTLPGQTVKWQIVNGTPANNPNEKCENFDERQVSLRFKGRTSPFEDGKRVVSPENGSSAINETILKKNAVKRTFRYVVRYKEKNAGPDPDVDVDCGGCAPP
jgi:hypothetical protein